MSKIVQSIYNIYIQKNFHLFSKQQVLSHKIQHTSDKIWKYINCQNLQKKKSSIDMDYISSLC